jgi:hypothetical protein
MRGIVGWEDERRFAIVHLGRQRLHRCGIEATRVGKYSQGISAEPALRKYIDGVKGVFAQALAPKDPEAIYAEAHHSDEVPAGTLTCVTRIGTFQSFEPTLQYFESTRL